MPRAPVVISSDFITDCLAKDELCDPAEYILHDEKGEAQNGCILSESLERAKLRGAGLFENMTINVTPGVKGGLDAIRHIIQANGGQCVAIRAPRAKKYGESGDGRMILISSEEDGSYFDNFLANAKKQKKAANIYSTEWILTGVLRMKIEFENEFSLIPSHRQLASDVPHSFVH